MINVSLPEVETQLRPRITVFGVGGAGGNAVNNMIKSNLEGVDFVVANTDAQALTSSLAPRRIQLGTTITRGLGAGSRPDVGRAAAEEQAQDILGHLEGANMIFITAGMGGGTGTGAAPVIARVAREQGLLTVGVVTKPFHFEGAHRMRLAESGISELQQYVDTLIIIPNQNLFRIANEKTTFADAFKMADDVLHSGVRGVTDLMVMPGLINLDFADIRSVMTEMGKAMMGTGEASGEGRSIQAAEAAISNPLLDDVSMKGARGVLINITGGYDMTLFEVDEAANRIRDEVDPDANIIFGSTFDQSMEGRMRVSVVATGIDAALMQQLRPQNAPSLSVLPGGKKHPQAPAAGAPGSSGGPGNYMAHMAQAPMPPAQAAHAATMNAGAMPMAGGGAGMGTSGNMGGNMGSGMGAAMGSAATARNLHMEPQPQADYPAVPLDQAPTNAAMCAPAMPTQPMNPQGMIDRDPSSQAGQPQGAYPQNQPPQPGQYSQNPPGQYSHSQNPSSQGAHPQSPQGQQHGMESRAPSGAINGPLRGERKDNMFVAPRPAEAGPRPSSASGHGEAPRSASLGAPNPADRPASAQPQQRKPSLFERMTGLGTGVRQLMGGGNDAHEAQPAQSPQHSHPQPQPGRPSRPSMPGGAPRAAEPVERPMARPAHDDDSLDIPAFLRRQNN